jgi:hypothetical protein
MSKRYNTKGRIPGQWTAIRWEVMHSAAWKHMSMGARMLYVALIKNLSFNADNNGKIFLSTRKAADELGASQRIVCVWFRELEHFGFITMTEPGTLGPKGKATRWRITDVGWGKLDGKSIEPTKDYLKWSGELFDRQPKKQNNGERKYSGRGKKVLRGSDDQKYSLPTLVRNKGTQRGRPLTANKSTQAFMGLFDVWEVPYILEDHHLVDERESDSIYARMSRRVNPEDVLVEVVRRAYRDYGKSSKFLH